MSNHHVVIRPLIVSQQVLLIVLLAFLFLTLHVVHFSIVNSSAYIKAFKREKGSSLVKSLLEIAERTNDIKLFLSYWVINESISVIDKTQRQRKIITKERKQIIIATILKKIIDYSESNIIVVPLNHKFVRDSVSPFSYQRKDIAISMERERQGWKKD